MRPAGRPSSGDGAGQRLAAALGRSAVRQMRPLHYPDFPGLRLDLNTNLFGLNPAVAIVGARLAAGELDLAQYPQSDALDLRRQYAAALDVSEEQVVCGNGSDELIDLLYRAFLDAGQCLAFAVPTFSMYEFYATVHGVRVAAIPLGRDFALPTQELLRAAPKMVMVCSPNNPTGTVVPEPTLRALAQALADRPKDQGGPGLLVLDEAYVHFCEQDGLRLLPDFPNVVVLRTLSKAVGLAAARVGLAISSSGVAERLLAVKQPFNLSALSIALAAEALHHKGWVDEVVQAVARERRWLGSELGARGFVVHPSGANFLLARCPVPSRHLSEALADHGLAVKDFGTADPLVDCLRITLPPRAIGTKLLAVIDTVLAAHGGGATPRPHRG